MLLPRCTDCRDGGCVSAEDDVIRAVRQTRAFGIARVALLRADFAGLDPGLDGRSPANAYDGAAELVVARARLWMGPGELAMVAADVLGEVLSCEPSSDELARACRQALLRWRSQPEVERARDVATIAHAGQLDRAGKPYIGHPERVAARQRSSAARTAAWLHDVVEDTPIALADLRAGGFERRVVDAVDALTHREGEDYLSYVRRAGANPIGRLVKIADLRDNMDLSRFEGCPAADVEAARRRIERKYAPALEMLGAG